MIRLEIYSIFSRPKYENVQNVNLRRRTFTRTSKDTDFRTTRRKMHGRLCRWRKRREFLFINIEIENNYSISERCANINDHHALHHAADTGDNSKSEKEERLALNYRLIVFFLVFLIKFIYRFPVTKSRDNESTLDRQSAVLECLESVLNQVCPDESASQEEEEIESPVKRSPTIPKLTTISASLLN